MLVIRMVFLIVLASLASSASARAGWKSCAAAAVTSGICRQSTNVVITFDMPPAARTALLEAFARRRGYAAEVTCTSAMVAASECSSTQAGQQVPNPETKAAFFIRVTAEDWRRLVREYQVDQAVQPVRETELAKPEADLGSPP